MNPFNAARHATSKRLFVFVALYAGLALIALLPIFFVTVPPLVDYPNHLARMHILAHGATAPGLQNVYVADLKLHPNMAMEIIVPLLARVMPIYWAGKIFVAATLLLLLGGTITLRKVVTGQVGLWPILTLLILYNNALFWGFLGYLFAVGLALFAFSGWIALRDHRPLLRATLFSAVSIILFFSHIFGLFVYGLLVLGYELWLARDKSRIQIYLAVPCGVPGIQFAIPALLFWLWITGDGSTDPAITYYGPLKERLTALVSPVNFALPWVDIPLAVALGVLVVACCRNRSVGYASELKIPLLLLAGVSLATPTFLVGVWGTHIRIPPVIACILIAGVRLEPEARQFAKRVVYLAVVVFLIRIAVIMDAWLDLDRKFDEFRHAIGAIEPGQRLLAVQDDADLPPGKTLLYGWQFWHLSTLAVIERAAFVPFLFTGHVGIRAAPDLQYLDTPVGGPLSRAILQEGRSLETSRFPLGHRISRYLWAFWPAWPQHYDYVVSIRFANRTNPDPDHLRRVKEGSFFDIYRVFPPRGRP